MSSILRRADLDRLIELLRSEGYEVIGPTVENGAIVYEPISTAADLPVGWTDLQDNATYRLTRRDDDAVFGYALAPQSWKRYLFPPDTQLWESSLADDGSFTVTETVDDTRYAFLGVRACELAAIGIQDKVFSGGAYRDNHYTRLRENALFVGVNCTDPAGTCFCVSMDTGPAITSGYDLVLTELLGEQHRFVIDAGSETGSRLLEMLPLEPAEPSDDEAAAARLETARLNMGRVMDTTDIRDLLYRNYENPQWQDVADRCLSCTNCTLVCPTCFCNTVGDTTTLDGATATRSRSWDSCFTLEFSYIHGGSIRTSGMARYRQWMTHKLATWIDQFDTSGCVGCGRCITWCPAGIDITQEVKAIRELEGAGHVR